MAIKKISANLLGNNAVTAASIAGGAISAADIADNSITAAKISTSTFAIDSLTVNTSDLVVDTANNRVGIGTTSPATTLAINGATQILAGNALYFQNSAADANGTISGSGGAGENTLSFNSGAMVLNASGNVGIGTDNPQRSPLHLVTSGTDYCQVHMTNGTSGSTSSDGLTLFTNGTDAGLIQRENSYLLFGTNDTERMRIDSSGNVGITTGAKFGFGGVTATTAHYIKYDSGIDGLELNGWGGLKFTTGTNGANERMRITSGGTLAINTQSPSSTPLHVNSFASNTLTAVFEAPASNNFDVQFRSHSYYGGITFYSDFYGSMTKYGEINQYINGGMYATANRGYWYFLVGNAGTTRIQYQMDWDNHKWFTNTAYNGAMELTYVGHLRINGSLYQSYNFSDERLKENVQTLTGSLEKVKQLRGVSFNFKESKEGIYTSEDNQIGVVAQELEQHYPELISEQAEMTQDGEDGVTYKYVHYEKLTPILIEAIKEQQTIIDDLKSRLDSAGL